jgi:tape measure domain-containing protein
MNIKAYLGLEDKMTPTLSKAEQQAINNIKTFNNLSNSINDVKKALDNAEKANPNVVNTKAYQDAVVGLEKMEGKLHDVANGEKQLQDETEKTTNKLTSFISKIASFTALVSGAKFLIGMSDTYTQTHARLGMITEDVDGLEKQIYHSAQRSRIAYQTVADTVSKLGMQAGDAFNNSSEEVLAFSELLNKTFKTQGMDANAIASTMYNMTQSLASGRLMGQDYRILKQNAPQMVKYLRQYYNVSQAELDDLVSKGQVTAKGLKNAIFAAGDDIEKKFKKMPVTFADAWTKFQNTLQKMLQPLAKILSVVAEGLDGIVTFLSENSYILYGLAAAIGIVVTAWIAYNVATGIATVVTAIATAGISTLVIVVGILAIVIGVLVGVLIYLWNTNDEAAEAILEAWDNICIGIKNAGAFIKFVWTMLQVALAELEQFMYNAGAGFLTAWQGVATGFQTITSVIAHQIQNLANVFIDAVNLAKQAGGSLGIVGMGEQLDRANFADKLDNQIKDNINERWKNINDLYEKGRAAAAKADALYQSNTLMKDVQSNIIEMKGLDATRKERVANREKLTGEDIINSVKEAMGLGDELADVMGTDGTGGKALKVTTNDKLLSDEDIQLLLDVATRDYKIDYQQITPNVTLTFGDIRETADVDAILDEVADRLEEIYDANLEVSPA